MSYRHLLLTGSCPYCETVLSLPWELAWIQQHRCDAQGGLVLIEGTVLDALMEEKDPALRAKLLRLYGEEDGSPASHPVAGEPMAHSEGAQDASVEEAKGGRSGRTPKRQKGKTES